MVPDRERGLGLWLKRQREKEGYPSQRLLLDALARQGIKIHASAYATLESHGAADTPGKRRTIELIAKFYGVPPPDMSDAPAEGMAALIEALSEQAKALRALVGAIERQAADQVTIAEQQSLALGVLARVLAPRGTDIGAALQGATSDLAALRRLSSEQH